MDDIMKLMLTNRSCLGLGGGAGNGILDLLGDRGQAVGHVLVKLRGLGVLLNLTLEGGGDVLEQISHGLPHVLEGDGHLGLNVLDGTLLGSIWPGEDHLEEGNGNHD